MKLKKVILKNFRGYKNDTIDLKDNMNVLIGKNDVGKSTVLEALDIFFNDTKPDFNDLNKNSIETKISIICLFEVDIDNEPIIIDTSNPTDLKKEFLLNSEGYLEIIKEYDVSENKVSACKTYIIANYPNEFSVNPLILQKIDKLKTILETKKSVIDNYDKVNKTKSAEIRDAIYNSIVNIDDNLSIQKLDTTKEDMKNIFDSIKKYIPNYFLFKSDRKNTDDDTEIQNPLKIATKNKLCELEEQLKNIQKEIDIFIQGVAIKTIEKFNEFNDQLKIELNAKLETKPWESLFNYSLIGNDNIPLNKRGSGVRRLILLSYFRAEAERLVTDKPAKNIIYAIEEPETSQHPNFQLNILETLLEISNDEKHQVIITTHTPEIAKIIGINSIILIDKNEGDISIHNSSNMNSIKIAECLGILPNLVSKTVLCVEGDNDVKFFRNIFNIPEIKNIFDINKIAIIPMHGSSLVNWINENYFKDSSIKEIHIYDSDVKNYIDKVADMNIKNDGRRKGFITNKNEAENYIKSEYIENEFKIKFNAEDIDNWDKLDIPKYLDEKVSLKEKDIKNIINSKLSKMLTSNDLLNNNSLDEVKVWINAIKDYYEN